MNIPPTPDPRHCLVEGLQRQLDHWTAGRPTIEAATLSTGAAALDRLLPGGGLRPGMLVEWVGEGGGRKGERGRGGECGMLRSFRIPPTSFLPPHAGAAATLSLVSAREACRAGGVLVVIDRRRMFYPPAAAAWGVDLRRLIVVHPRDRRDELWAAVQSLRSPAVAAVWAMVDRLDQRASRRLQLAAQAGRALGLVLRPPDARHQPSWADVRLGVEARDCKLQIANCKFSIPLPPSTFPLPPSSDPRLLRVRVLRTRRGRVGATVVLEIDDVAHVLREATSNDDANSLPVASQLADPAAAGRPVRVQ